MTKLDTYTEEYEHCGECAYAGDYFDTGKKGFRCENVKRKRVIPDLWGDIPDWCPLPDKEEK